MFPKPLLFIDQYKKAVKSVSAAVNSRKDFSLTLKLTEELQSIVTRQNSLYLKKDNLEKLCFKKHSLKNYRWKL